MKRRGDWSRRLLDYLTQPQWRIVDLYRVASRLDRSGHTDFAMLVATLNRILFGSEIQPRARIGERLTVRHGVGIVIGRGARLGDDCVIFHQVTIGLASFDGPSSDDMYPTVGDRVVIYAGAKILGPVTIGDDAIVAAGAVVLSDVPSGHVALGVPAYSRPRRTTRVQRDTPVAQAGS